MIEHKFANAEEVERVYGCIHGTMTAGQVSRASGVPFGRTVSALRALSYQRKVTERRAGPRRLYTRRKN